MHSNSSPTDISMTRKLKEWIGNISDPNDPRNLGILHLLSSGNEGGFIKTHIDLLVLLYSLLFI